ncbi:gata transcription factor [Musa troglodytarum]|uniref:Gata transcription factor n=1 Tax=Musa troglodytarum TaxID=320322 RepID=A0A9E7JM28_9LILI|nr:gata transcription factor [Musa troglodytarum]
MSGNPNPAADAKPAGAGRFRGLGMHHLADEHHVLPSVILPAQIDDPSAVGRSGELIAAADAQTLQQYHEADHSSGSHGMEEDGVGAVENEGMETEEQADPSHLGDAQGLIAPQVGGNQLTLSFQGEVFVFDSVSPEKVRMNVPHRVASLMRFREKRKERNFEKKIRYTVRKEVALRMQRNRGQFTSSKSKTEDSTGGATTSDANQNWGSPENKIPAASACHHCGINAKSTPMMRRGPDGPRTLCNACGLVWANKGIMRDLSKNPSPAIPNTSPEPKEGQNNSAEAAIAQSIAVAANGHDTS